MEKKATRIGLNLLALLLVFCMGFGFLSASTVKAEGLKDTSEIQNTFNKEDEQIKISTPEDLKALREYVKSGKIMQGQSALLMKDIDLNGFDLGEYNSATAWTLSFDGQGHTITGFSETEYGLFGSHFTAGKDKSGSLVDTVIKNLHLNINVDIPNAAYMDGRNNFFYGAFANNTNSNGGYSIENCVVSGSIDLKVPEGEEPYFYCGTFLGDLGNGAMKPVMKNCMSMVEMTIDNKGSYEEWEEAPELAGLAIHRSGRGYAVNCLSLSKITVTEGSDRCHVYGTSSNAQESYYNSDLVKATEDIAGANTGAKTTAELKTAETYAGWDTKVWSIEEGQYPALVQFAGTSQDFTALKALIAKAKEIKNDDSKYTPASFQTLQDAIANAEKALTAEPVLKDTEYIQTAALQSAMDSLVPQGEWKTAVEALEQALKNAETVSDTIVYTSSSQKAFDQALESAQKMSADKSKASAKEISDAAGLLSEAQKNLIENADTTKYYSVKDKAIKDTNRDYVYTSDSWEKYEPVFKVYSLLQPKDTPKEEQKKLDDAADNLAEAYTWLVKNADFTTMRAAIVDAVMQDEEDYTAATWEAQKKALDAANQFDQTNTPVDDQEKVDGATKALEAATAKLVLKTDWEALQAALKNAADLEAQEEAYTTNSWMAFKTALDTAKGIEETNTTTQAVAGAAKALTDAQAALVKKADSTALNSAIAEAGKLKEADYTSASWPAFAEALANARAVDQNNATQAAVDAAREGLELAQSRLIEKTSFAGLNEAIQAAEALKEADYTKDSWKAADVAAALAEAKAIEQDPENTPQADVDAAVQKMADAMEQLVKKGDPKALDEAVKSAEALKAEDYTTSTWTALQAALAEAKALDRDNADQTAVNTQTEKLVAAMDALVKAADKAALTEACDAAEAKDSGIYTQATYATLQTALAEAKTVLDNGDAAQQEVDKALEGLNKALAGLIKVEKAEAEGYQVTAEIPDNAELSITKQDEQKTEAAQKNIRKEYQDAELLALFDINLGDYQLGTGESVKITIALPEAAWGYDSYKVYHEKEDGSIEYLDVVYDAANHTLTFTADSFSDFGVVGFKNASADNPDGNNGSNANGAGGGSSQNGSGTAQGSGTGAGVSTGITADSPSAALAAAALLAAAGLAAFLVYRRKTTK